VPVNTTPTTNQHKSQEKKNKKNTKKKSRQKIPQDLSSEDHHDILPAYILSNNSQDKTHKTFGWKIGTGDFQQLLDS
jgi:hypothetical protein